MILRYALMRPTWFGSRDMSPACCGSSGNFMFYLPASIYAGSASGGTGGWLKWQLADGSAGGGCARLFYGHIWMQTPSVCQTKSDWRLHEDLEMSFSKLWCLQINKWNSHIVHTFLQHALPKNATFKKFWEYFIMILEKKPF